MECIVCGGQLNSELYEGVKIDRCRECGGVWLDWGELGPIIETRQEDVATEEEQQAVTADQGEKPSGETRQCPTCGKPMKTFNYAVNSGVHLDKCPEKHGIWLDPGELEQVQRVMEELEREYEMDGVKQSQIPDTKNCPRCNVALHEANYETVTIDRCPECGGNWLDEDELAAVIEAQQEKFTEDEFTEIRAEESAAEVKDEQKISDEYTCVVCDRTMNRSNYQYTSGIIIDRCPVGHGVWLDRNELAKVQVFSERWEARDGELAAKYKGALAKAESETEQHVQEDVSEMKTSRFGVVNRFFRSVSRLGWL